jgi:hypothetical protein
VPDAVPAALHEHAVRHGEDAEGDQHEDHTDEHGGRV